MPDPDVLSDLVIAAGVCIALTLIAVYFVSMG
jgi:hypothetical protein